MKVQEDSLFIADSHYNLNRQELKQFLLQLESKEIKTSQLFLMGVIFDFLSYEIVFFKKQNQDIINLLNELSTQIEIVYLEGNHDFSLKKLFPHILIVPRKQQPLYCNYQDKNVAISHGDIFTPFEYNLYTSIIRNKIFLQFLNFIDINNWLSKRVNDWLLQKKICNKCTNFNDFSNYRISLYPLNIDLIIEGHFHYGEQQSKYINIPSLACAHQYFRIKSKNFQNLN